MHTAIRAAVFGLSAGALAQQIGTLTKETHPPLSLTHCTASGCTKEQHSVVLDANWRWVHSTSGSNNCYSGQTWDTTLCPDGATCAKNCAVDGADYSGTYGVTSDGDTLSVTLKTGSNVGSRLYMLGVKGQNYELFDLLNQEFTFDVDVSTLPCGVNGALYFSEMPRDGGLSATNKAGAPYGTGYCDSQCPKDIKFINGKANSDGWVPSSGDKNSGAGPMGACCNEMDIWEANKISTAVTPHPCTKNGLAVCTDDTTCGAAGICDRAGCDFNAYRLGNTSFYGPGKTVDTSSKFTVVTQFITDDGTAAGNLKEIRRLYVQNGKVIGQPKSDITGISGDSITEDFCKAQKSVFGDTNTFDTHGGLKTMGAAFKRGMTLVLSIWDDYTAEMEWLDGVAYPTTADTSKPGVARGTCATGNGAPATVESNSGSATVKYGNIKVGPFGTTYKSS
ncbi:hypothetical protein LTR78_005794 [Recurvomyces mirabilis]|uniref:Glucanase n=1 Tax=Recurvomyces mirabilis TaxID=574656 RepID=A0AAE0WM98_9PEZI|nr:hypothetical protein LTR78_005794 [Recurvomyces mirabilis]KAK5154174.1 hypothetical protein LTS14_006859 [Recurvomyces mirabilis]